MVTFYALEQRKPVKIGTYPTAADMPDTLIDSLVAAVGMMPTDTELVEFYRGDYLWAVKTPQRSSNVSIQ